MRLPRLLAIALLMLAAGTLPAFAHTSWKDVLQSLRQQTGARAASLPQSQVAAGLREALARGTTQAIRELGRRDGFWGNPAVRIPLPASLRKAGELARRLGQGAKVDAFQLSLNRAAEKAVPQVADVFGAAIRHMSLEDARRILTGPDDAATRYFRRVAGPELTARIRPIVARATDSVGVTRRYKAFMGSARGAELGGLLGRFEDGHAAAGGDLDQYVTEQALNGLFSRIAVEEKAIRHDPAARTTRLLRKVFGHR